MATRIKEYGIDKEALKRLRFNYSLSLDDFSKVIGCAKKTLISYEQGSSVPNDSYLVTLNTLIENPELIVYLIDSNKERFTEKELNRITKKINAFLKGNNEKKNSLNHITNNMDANNLYVF